MRQIDHKGLDSVHHRLTTAWSKERSGKTQHVPGFGLCVPARGYNGLRAAFVAKPCIEKGARLSRPPHWAVVDGHAWRAGACRVAEGPSIMACAKEAVACWFVLATEDRGL